MTDDERSVMNDLLRYAEWTQKFWRVLRSHPDMVEIDMAITAGKALLEVNSDDA